jgi:magnesium transporter
MLDLKLPNAKLKIELQKLHPSDIATLFVDYEDEQLRIMQLLGVKRFADVFYELSDTEQTEFFKKLSLPLKKSLLIALEIDDLVDFLKLLEKKEQDELIKQLPKTTLQEVIRILTYKEDTAGSISSPHFISLPMNYTVKEATHYVTAESSEKDEVDVIFFHDDEDKFIGAITLQQLIITRATQDLDEVINKDYPFARENESVKKTLAKIRNYDIDIIPVLNDKHVMVGIVTADDALAVMTEIHEDTMSEMVKVEEIDENDSAFIRSYKRLPWLLISAVLNLVIASLLSIFSGTLEAHVALILFQPMILGMAGNIGTQSISVTILGLHQEKIKPQTHILRETVIGLINSVIAGIIGFGIVYLFLNVLPKDYNYVFELALTVGLSLAIAMFISSIAGVLLPFILRAFGADEKAASGPLISTINDFTALGTYFLVATIILMTLV